MRGSLFQFWELSLAFAFSEMRIRYAQTWLGPLWYLLAAVFTSGVCSIFFSAIGHKPNATVSPFYFYLCGFIFWNYFSECLDRVAHLLTSQRDLLRRTYFPRLALPVGYLFANLPGLLIQFSVFIILAWGELCPTRAIFLLPVLVVMTAGVALGAGLLVTSLTVRYRDLHHLLRPITTLWFLSTPIVYSLSTVKPAFRYLLCLNPLSFVIETARAGLFGLGTSTHASLSLFALLLLVSVGFLVFSRVEKNFVDYV